MNNNNSSNSNNKSSKTYMSVSGKGAVQRIRAPSQTDVLLGRGGGINSHVGNQVFREWVRERKEDYNLAGSKLEKTKVATEVMDRVKAQSPPGRFLQRESGTTGMGSSTGWWVEVDFNRALAKTSQALREGAPKIRAAHQSELLEARAKVSNTGKRRAPASEPITKATLSAPSSTRTISTQKITWPQTVPATSSSTIATIPVRAPQASKQLPLSSLSRPLMSNRDFQRTHPVGNEPASKRARTTTFEVDGNAETPPLLPTTQTNRGNSNSDTLPPPLRLDGSVPPVAEPPRRTPSRQLNGLPRTHSLAFSDISTPIEDDDFVNPFLDETDIFESSLYKDLDTSSTPSLSNKSQPLVRNVSSEKENPTFDTMDTSSSSTTSSLPNSTTTTPREDYRSMAELYDFPAPSSEPSSSSPLNSLTSYYYDDQNNINNSSSSSGAVVRDFNDDVKQMWDIVQPDGDITSPNMDEEEKSDTIFIPWRGGILKRRYGSHSASSSSSCKRRMTDSHRGNSGTLQANTSATTLNQ